MKLRKFAITLMVLFVMLPVATFASNHTNDTNQYLSFDTVRIDGEPTEDGDILYVERGDTLDIRVTVEAGDEEVRQAQMQAMIAGYRYQQYERNLVTDFTETFNLPAQNRRTFSMEVEIPRDIEKKDAKLRILAADENSANVLQRNHQLNIEGTAEEDAVRIRNFEISPTTNLAPGQALSFTTRVSNDGNYDLDDVTARVSIPGLGISDFETVDRLDTEETRTFESMFLRMPQDAEPGQYNVQLDVEFDRFHTVSQTKTITIEEVEEDETPEQTSTFTVPDSIDLEAGGSSALLPVLVENQGPQSQNYMMSVEGVTNWGSASFEPSSALAVGSNKDKTGYVRLQADEDASGEQVFTLRIEHGEQTEELTVVANVQEGQTDDSSFDLRTVLEWSLLVLVVLLILLGLVLLFTRMGGRREDEGEEEAQTYY